jgi:hypothetical protein
VAEELVGDQRQRSCAKLALSDTFGRDFTATTPIYSTWYIGRAGLDLFKFWA